MIFASYCTHLGLNPSNAAYFFFQVEMFLCKNVSSEYLYPFPHKYEWFGMF